MGFLGGTCRCLSAISLRRFWYLPTVLLMLPSAIPAIARQVSAKPEGTKSVRERLQEHYDAARTFQISGDKVQAAAEYKAFLGEALRQIADSNISAEKFEDASKLFAEALTLAPENSDANLDYAALCLEEGKPKEAQALAERAIQLAPGDARSQ